MGKGNVDLGITGHDVILESEMSDHVTEILRLGFGKCSLQVIFISIWPQCVLILRKVQVPERSSIKTIEDLAGRRVVTSFEILARKFFSELDDKLQLQGDQRTQIEYVGGSVEAACALGLADGIGMSQPTLVQPFTY